MKRYKYTDPSSSEAHQKKGTGQYTAVPELQNGDDFTFKFFVILKGECNGEYFVLVHGSSPLYNEIFFM